MKVKNRVPALAAQRFGGQGEINLSRIQEETGLSYGTVSSWVKDRVNRVDFDILERWCEYFGVQPGDILVYEPEER